MSFKLDPLSEGKCILTQETFNKLDKLPQELWDNITPYLKVEDLDAVMRANRALRRRVREAVNHNEPDSIKKFASGLMKSKSLNPEKFPTQRSSLREICQNITPQKFCNFKDMEEYLLKEKQKLIKVIATVDAETQDGLKLESGSPPRFMEKIFEEAAWERQIAEANLLPEESRGEALLNISQKLREARKLGRAFEVVMSIPESQRGALWKQLMENIFEEAALEKQIDAANLLPEESRRDALLKISQKFLKADSLKINRAFEIVMSIPESQRDGFWECTIKEICQYFLVTDQINKAFEAARFISNKLTKAYVFKNISKALAEIGEVDKAFKTAESIPNTLIRGNALLGICKELIRSNSNSPSADQIRRAIEGVQSIPDEFARRYALEEIIEILTQIGETAAAVKATELLSDVSIIGDALNGISRNLILNDRIQEASQVAQLIPDELSKGHALVRVIEAFIQAGEVREAFKTAQLIPNEGTQGRALDTIRKAFVQHGQFNEAFEAAELILNPLMREQAFKDISEALMRPDTKNNPLSDD